MLHSYIFHLWEIVILRKVEKEHKMKKSVPTTTTKKSKFRMIMLWTPKCISLLVFYIEKTNKASLSDEG